MDINIEVDNNLEFEQSEYQMYTSSGIYLMDSINKEGWYRDIAFRIYELSQYYVPVEKGTLKYNSFVEKLPGGNYRIVYKEPYAMYVHELIGRRHKVPTQSKFLEDAGYEILNDMTREYGIDVPLFTFHMDYSEFGEVALYLDSISTKEFMGEGGE